MIALSRLMWAGAGISLTLVQCFLQRTLGPSNRISRKAIRFVAYDGASRADTVTHRQGVHRGYADGFSGLIDYIDGLLPHNEHIGKALRTETPLFPPIAICELLANALIHQDMTITGAGPLIELFRDRLEITNPGTPLIKPERFTDSAPRSRNEALASLMRRMRIREEQGTGIDKSSRQWSFFNCRRLTFDWKKALPESYCMLHGGLLR